MDDVRAFRKAIGLAVLVSVAAVPETAPAETLTILLGELPPHTTRDGVGREADTIRQVADACGWSVTVRVEPFSRHWRSFEGGAGDAVGGVPEGLDLGGYRTAPYITYRNGVTVLESSGITVESLADLAGLSVVAFYDAKSIIPAVGEAMDTFADYREMADQVTHSRLLFGGRVDAIVGEGMIVAEYNQRLAADDNPMVDASQPVTFMPIFEPTHYAMVFRDPDRGAAFDACLAEVSDEVAAINARYIDRYRDVIGDTYDP
ncbi:transporter substrate-binding domain-containing protein [Roseospira navarrensis]|uniref:Transporter substrate-binding domain-containing protein n=1 Tax=Roseospira navarrensis TaxID=140058 RepID=A0A7X1ZBK0_9PROT|nr:transporter substrate-binding domain-containing protein [Roseospira navarrensis]MQX35518.1 transporter substrate-binding domain-containing protein [Roseospira navarrensis]